MATKDNFILVKGSHDVIISNDAFSNRQYNNLNLNRNYQFSSSNAFLGSTKSFTAEKRKDFTNNNDFQRKKEVSHLWIKSKTVEKNSCDSEKENCLKEGKNSSCISNNGSTLFLHIEAYENSTAVNFSDGIKAESSKQSRDGFIKNRMFIFQNPFEFPRQQESVEAVTPEVAQFRASQQLLSPTPNPNPNQQMQNGGDQQQQPMTHFAVETILRQQPISMHKICQKLRIPSGVKEEGGEGIPNWFPGREIIALMREFRQHVITKNVTEVKHFVKKLIDDDDSEQSAEYLGDLLCDRTTSEPSKEALLTSVLIGSRPLVEFILQLFAEFPGEERNGVAKCDAFAPYITPLMLACLCNNYAIVECLLLRGHKIQLPHRTDCLCSSCGKIAHSFHGRHQRLDTYRAVSSEAYLWLATRDPLLSSINLVEDLMVCQSYDTEHAEIYGQLITKLQNFSSDFIQQCRNVEETDCILNQREGASLSECDSIFPRVRLALDANMKPLLSHMNVQSSLRARWLGTWAEGDGNLLRDTGRFIRHTLGYPILAFLHSISGGILVKSFEVPYARYLSYTTSYLLFIFLLAVLRYLKSNGIGEMFQNAISIYVFLFVLGQILSEFLEFSRRGVTKFFGLWWRFFDFILLYVFVVSFICWSGANMSPAPTNLRRKHWVAYDPTILFEVSFGTACLMSFLRTFYFIQLHRTLGSTVISIGRCVGQVFSYFGIMAIVIASFGLGISTVLQPYDSAIALQPDGVTKTMTSSFANLILSIRSLFWGFFGYLNYSEYITIVGNAGPNFEPTNHYVTHVASEFLVALYYIVTVITLLNLMISLLVKKADEVLANEDVEWKFTRAHMYFEFFEDSAAVPPPFNLIYFVTSYIRKICSGKYAFAWPDLLITKKLTQESQTINSTNDYLKLLVNIFRRYQATKFNHYRTIQNIDADRKSKKEGRVFMTFLNGRKPLDCQSQTNSIRSLP